MSFFVLVTSSAFLASFPPILSVPDFASCFDFNLLIVSKVFSEGVRSLFSPDPEIGWADPVELAGLLAGVAAEESASVPIEVELVELEELAGLESFATSFFLISTSCFLEASLTYGASSFFLQVVMEHQNQAKISSIMNICAFSLTSEKAPVSTFAVV